MTDVAVLSGARRLALFHHDPLHDDDMVDEIAEYCRRRAADAGADVQVFGAAEGQAVDL